MTWLICPGSNSADQRSGSIASSLRLCEPRSEKLTVSSNQLGDGGGLLNRRAATGESEELLRQVARPEGSVLGVVEAALHLVVRREPGGDERDVADDGGKQVVEIVRDAAGEKAELLERLGFAALAVTARPLR